MRNPFARAAKREAVRPSLRERAAALRASASRVIRLQRRDVKWDKTHPDAALLDAAERARPFAAQSKAVRDEFDRLNALSDRLAAERFGPRPTPCTAEANAYDAKLDAVQREVGRDAAWEAMNSNGMAIWDLLGPFMEEPAKTLEGAAAKAIAADLEMWGSDDCAREISDLFYNRSATQAVHAAPAAGVASPILLGMVEEWERLLSVENSGLLSDEEVSPICAARYRIHGEICAFPAASVADLAAKLPLFRDEVVASQPSDIRRPTMDHQSWCSIVRDLEAVAAVPPLRADREARAVLPPSSVLRDATDLSSEKMETLLVLHDAARTLSDMGAALLCQPRFQDDDRRNQGAASRIVEWITDASHYLASAAVQEARKRQPSDADGRMMRLATLAAATIENCDADETLALARDLHAYAVELQQ